jgi:hypothetical protein
VLHSRAFPNVSSHVGRRRDAAAVRHAPLLSVAQAQEVARSNALAGSGQPSSGLVVLTGLATPTAVDSFGEPRALSATTSTGTRDKLLFVERVSTLHGTRVEVKPARPQHDGHARRTKNDPTPAAPAPRVKQVKFDEFESRSVERVPFAIDDGTGAAEVDPSSMPAPPTVAIGSKQVLFASQEARAAVGTQAESLVLLGGRPVDSSQVTYTGREVTFHGLATGTLLTVVGTVWVDGRGRVSVHGSSEGPAIISQLPLPSLLSSIEANGAGFRFGAALLGLLGGGLVLFGGIALWREWQSHHGDERENAVSKNAPTP